MPRYPTYELPDGEGGGRGGGGGSLGETVGTSDLRPTITMGNEQPYDPLAPPLPEEEPLVTQQSKTQDRRRRQFTEQAKAKPPSTSGIKL